MCPKLKTLKLTLSHFGVFFLVIGFLIVSGPFAYAEGVQLLGSPRQDAVLLRWAPMSPAVWRLGNEYGYVVERFTVLRNGQIPDSIVGERLFQTPLRPMEQAAWERYIDEDKYVAIAAECLFSSTFRGLDAGGNPHMVYKMHQEEQHRFSFALYAADQSVRAAELSGLFLTDESARAEEKYLYRVFINCPDSLAVDTGSVFTGLSEYRPLPKPQAPEAEWGDKKVSLAWNTLYLNHIYNSYVLERSENGGASFERVSDNALVQLADEGVGPDYMYRSDSLANNQQVYYYRVRGRSAFGEMGPPSDSIFGQGLMPLTHAPVIIDKKVVDNTSVELTWEYPDEMNPYVMGFKIYRSSGPKQRKEVIYVGDDGAQRSFVDTMPDMTNYYLVSAFNNQEEKISLIETYAARVDSFPPLPPKGLVGSVDSLGQVQISWLPNRESDLEGYRVYVSNHPDHEFILSTASVLRDTVFADSINIRTLTSKVYYKVTAVDVRQNQSALSDVLILQRPDVIPPVAPRLLAVKEGKKGVELEWVPSSSVDVVQHHIYRKSDKDTSMVRVASVTEAGELLNFLDPLVSGGLGYSYCVVAEDDAGLLSPLSNQRFVRVSATTPEGIRLRTTRRIDHVVLEWDIQSLKLVERVVVFRSVDDGPLRLYGHSVGDRFEDRELSPGKTYVYRAHAVYNDGSASPYSEAVKVKL